MEALPNISVTTVAGLQGSRELPSSAPGSRPAAPVTGTAQSDVPAIQASQVAVGQTRVVKMERVTKPVGTMVDTASLTLLADAAAALPIPPNQLPEQPQVEHPQPGPIHSIQHDGPSASSKSDRTLDIIQPTPGPIQECAGVLLSNPLKCPPSAHPASGSQAAAGAVAPFQSGAEDNIRAKLLVIRDSLAQDVEATKLAKGGVFESSHRPCDPIPDNSNGPVPSSSLRAAHQTLGPTPVLVEGTPLLKPAVAEHVHPSQPRTNPFQSVLDPEALDDESERMRQRSEAVSHYLSRSPSLLNDDIAPNFAGFQQHVLKLNPLLSTKNNYLVDRIARQQCIRYKRLLGLRVKHQQAIAANNCSCGTMCISLGGSANVLVLEDDQRGLKPLSAGCFPQDIPMPPTVSLPAEFECQLCFSAQECKTLPDWINHVYEDLQPFTCTWEGCHDTMFKKKEWLSHAQIGDPWQPPGFLTPSRQEESLWSAHLLQEHVGPRNTVVDGSSTGYSTYRGPSATMMTPGYRHATANHGQPASAGTTFNLEAQTASSSTPQVSQQAGFHGYSAGSMPTTTTQTAPDMMQKYADSVGLGVAYAEYQSTLQEIFQNVRDDVLATASDSLLWVSEWLLSHVKELGLTSDDQNMYAQRIKLWNDFNYAWLAICQRQKEMMELGQQLQSGQILVPKEMLKKMGSELVRLCDNIESRGLVDYQYGVWEEQIIAILGECLDLYASAGETGVVAEVDSRRGRGHDAAEWGQSR